MIWWPPGVPDGGWVMDLPATNTGPGSGGRMVGFASNSMKKKKNRLVEKEVKVTGGKFFFSFECLTP